MIFKKGDKVYDAAYGWGKVARIDSYQPNYPNKVEFKNTSEWYTLDGRQLTYAKPSLSFTEYKLEGFSQKRPKEPLPFKAGDVVYLSDNECTWVTCSLDSIDRLREYVFYSKDVGYWSRLALENPLKFPNAKIYTKEDL